MINSFNDTKEEKREDVVNAALEIIKAEARGGCRMIDGIDGVAQSSGTELSAFERVKDKKNIVKIYADWIEEALKVPEEAPKAVGGLPDDFENT